MNQTQTTQQTPAETSANIAKQAAPATQATQKIQPKTAEPGTTAPAQPAKAEKTKKEKKPKTPPKNPIALFFWSLWQAIKRNSIPTAIMALLWMILWWLKSSGIQWAILWPLHFLTGALNGYSGNILGGTIGKTILLILFNSMVNSIFVGFLANSGNRKKRTKAFKNQMKDDVKSGIKNTILEKIPYYSKLKKALLTKSPQAFGWGALGTSSALFLYPFITGDGALVNSMVCLALSSSIGKQVLTQRGLFITLLNRALSKKHLKTINRGYVDRLIAGFTLGMALSVPIAALMYVPKAGTLLWVLCAKALPWILLGCAVVSIFWKLFGPILKFIAKGLGTLLKKLFAKKPAKPAEKSLSATKPATQNASAPAAKTTSALPAKSETAVLPKEHSEADK